MRTLHALFFSVTEQVGSSSKGFNLCTEIFGSNLGQSKATIMFVCPQTFQVNAAISLIRSRPPLCSLSVIHLYSCWFCNVVIQI